MTTSYDEYRAKWYSDPKNLETARRLEASFAWRFEEWRFRRWLQFWAAMRWIRARLSSN